MAFSSGNSSKEKLRRRKAASFSGRPLVMDNIDEELEGFENIRIVGAGNEGKGENGSLMVELLSDGSKIKARPHRSMVIKARPHRSMVGERPTFFTGSSTARSVTNEDLDDVNDNLTTKAGDVFNLSPKADDVFNPSGSMEDSLNLSVSGAAYPASSLFDSNRRVLGRKRGIFTESETNRLKTEDNPVIIIQQIESDKETQNTEVEEKDVELKRVPSSLFYLQYDTEAVSEDKRKRRISRANIPTSRRFSAASNYSFYADDDSEEDEGSEEEEEEEEEKEEQQVAEEDEVIGNGDLTVEIRQEIEIEERIKHILSNYYCQTHPETTTDLYTRTILEIDKTMKVFRLNDNIYKQVKVLLQREMDNGLQKHVNRLATVKMYPSYVRSLPSGTENGRYLALDLGGTNFRVLLVNLRGPEPPEVTCKLCLIPTRIMLGPGETLFDHIADCISEFLEELGLKDEVLSAEVPLAMGFTFSFPCIQEGLASARLVRWTKGFRCSGVEDEDVVLLLEQALARKGDLNVKCTAILNDNVGVLMTVAHTDVQCRVGVILGTGTNCCYVEDLDKVELWDGDRNDPKQVIINTEWGAFGDDGVLNFLRNSFDLQLDKESINPGHQLFEKMISGMYMGELVRLVLCELTSKGLLFGGEGSKELYERNRFYTKYISEIESDDPLGPMTNTSQVLQELNLERFTKDDCSYVQHVCWQISQRAAFLAGTAVASVIERLNLDHVTVAVDGSLYRFHSHFKDLIQIKISQLVEPNLKFKLMLADDGSGKGAALVAAVSQQENFSPSSLSSKAAAATEDSINHNEDDIIIR